MRITITQDQFDRASAEAALEPAQSASLWQLLRKASVAAPSVPSTSRFDFAHLAYYLGAMIVLGAMGWFMSTAWEAFGGQGIFAIAAIYAVIFLVAGREFLRRPDPALRTPGGLLVTLAVGMVPLMVYGLERWLGWWPQDDPGTYSDFHPWINGSWIVMELATIFAGAIALWFVRFPFLTAPVSLALWYLSMDTTPLLLGQDSWSYEGRCLLSLYFGLAMGLAAYVLDVRRRWQGPDYGFWLSFFGVLSFWGGLTLLPDSGELGKAGYALINLVLMAVGVALNRRVCVVFGALGVNYYLGHLAHEVFKDSLLFPFALSALGIFVIVAGVLCQRRSAAWQEAIRRTLPERYVALVPALQDPR